VPSPIIIFLRVLCWMYSWFLADGMLIDEGNLCTSSPLGWCLYPFRIYVLNPNTGLLWCVHFPGYGCMWTRHLFFLRFCVRLYVCKKLKGMWARNLEDCVWLVAGCLLTTTLPARFCFLWNSSTPRCLIAAWTYRSPWRIFCYSRLNSPNACFDVHITGLLHSRDPRLHRCVLWSIKYDQLIWSIEYYE
jgi:hypothetical protein